MGMRFVTILRAPWAWSTIFVTLCSCWCIAQEPISNENSPSDSGITIEVGTTSLPSRMVGWFEKEILAFMENHPNIRVKTIALSDPQRPEASIGDLPRLAENVIGIVGPYTSEASYLASREYIVPINNFLPDSDLSLDVFYDSAWPAVTYDDKIWGIPIVQTSMWMVCDWSLFEAAGIESPPRTWEEFVDIANRLTKDTDGDGEVDQWGLRLSPEWVSMEENLRLAIELQKGAMYLEGDTIDATGPAFSESLAFLRSIVNARFTKREEESVFVGQIPCGMQFMHCFWQEEVELTENAKSIMRDKRYRFAPIPTFGEPVFPSLQSLYLAVRKSTPEKEAASWELIKWISRRNAPLPEFWFGYPVRNDITQRPDYDEWSKSFCQGIEVPMRATAGARLVDYLLQVPDTAEDELILERLSAALRGEMGIDDFYRTISQDLEEVRIDRLDYPVKRQELLR